MTVAPFVMPVVLPGGDETFGLAALGTLAEPGEGGKGTDGAEVALPDLLTGTDDGWLTELLPAEDNPGAATSDAPARDAGLHDPSPTSPLEDDLQTGLVHEI